MTPITVHHAVRPARRSLATARVCDLFGLGDAEPDHVVADGLALDVRPGDVVLVTGPSGSGKSTLLRELGRQLNAVDVNALSLPDVPLADALPGPIDGRLATLAGCGLGEARLLLRTPAELSDGQRHRFRIAFAVAGLASRPREGTEGRSHSRNDSGGESRTPSPHGDGSPWLLLDEFAAVLDRPLAKVLAFALRKLAARAGVGVLAATTHDDLSADLAPDLWVKCDGDGRFDVERVEGGWSKKKWSASPTSSGCPRVPEPTGRTSLGGITAATAGDANTLKNPAIAAGPTGGLHEGYTAPAAPDMASLVAQLAALPADQRAALARLLAPPAPNEPAPSPTLDDRLPPGFEQSAGG